MHKTFLIIIIILVLAGGGYFLLNSSENTKLNLEPTVTKTVVDLSPVSETPANDSDVEETIVIDDKTLTEDAVIEEDEAMENSKSAVSYAADGFTPASLTINVGETVSFSKDGNISMWVASAIHPIHTIYPGFDQLASGPSYDFTFDNAGEWKYHNHLRPNHTGTIIVE